MTRILSHLLVEDGLGLSTETPLLVVIPTLTLQRQRGCRVHKPIDHDKRREKWVVVIRESNALATL